MIRQIIVIAIGFALGLGIGMFAWDKYKEYKHEQAMVDKESRVRWIAEGKRRVFRLGKEAIAANERDDDSTYWKKMDSIFIIPPRGKVDKKETIVLPEWKDNGYYRGYKEQGKEERVIR